MMASDHGNRLEAAPSDSSAVGVVTTDESSAPPERPGWFKKKTHPRPTRRTRKPFVDVDAVEEESLTPWQRVVRYIIGVAGAGYAFSLLLHVLLGLLASIYIIHSELGHGVFSTALAIGKDEPEEIALEDVVDTSIDMAKLDEPQIQLPDVLETPVIEVETPMFRPESQELKVTGGSDEEKKGGGGSGVGFEFARPGKVITKGNFTAWTVPEDPLPGQRYVIVIEVRIPEEKKGIRKYPRRDLVGQVIGTDGYRQSFPTQSEVRVSPFLKIQDGVTRLVIGVPGAERLVRDKITVQSLRILREKQTLEIEF